MTLVVLTTWTQASRSPLASVNYGGLLGSKHSPHASGNEAGRRRCYRWVGAGLRGSYQLLVTRCSRRSRNTNRYTKPYVLIPCSINTACLILCRLLVSLQCRRASFLACTGTTCYFFIPPCLFQLGLTSPTL